MATGFRALFIAFILVGLFLVAMVNFGVNVANENDANTTLLQNDAINQSFQNFGGEISSAEGNVNEQKGNLDKEVPTQPVGDFTLSSIIKGPLVFLGIVVSFWNIFTTMVSTSLGIPSVVIQALSAILVISLIFGFWRFLKSGE